MHGSGSRRLAGKVALVTGASRGIGAEIARLLAADGAKVIVNYVRNEEAAGAVVAAIAAAGGEAFAVRADVGEVAAAAPLVAAAVQRYGRLDILVNNAAVVEFARLDEVDEGMFDRLVATNVKATLFLSQAAARAFDERGGSIVNVSSIATRAANPRNIVYGLTKAAVEMMTRSMARDLGPRRIRVNAVAPGNTDTDMVRSVLSPEALRASIDMVALGRMGLVEDIAPVVAFLASDEAGWITGQTIHVNGGALV